MKNNVLCLCDPLRSGLDDQTDQFRGTESNKFTESTPPVLCTSIFKGAQHLFGKECPVLSWIQSQERTINSRHGYAFLGLRRAWTARVKCFNRSNSNCNCFRPAGVSLYACLSREVSSSSNRWIQPFSRSLRRAPKSVPVLRRTRPSLIVSISLINA